MGRYIGIDLGTTTSEVAYIKDGKPVVIRNENYGHGAVIPSVVTIKDGEIIVGNKSKRQAKLKPESTIENVKKLMGTDAVINIGDKTYLPQQISAMILRTLKNIAEEELGEIEEAVITVPANFDDNQRKATKEAAAIAGLKVERIINEPTAAAMAYGIANMKTNGNILVYDLGGGTFDCTVLEMFEGIINVKASRGDNNVGGRDFDRVIEEFILDYLKTNSGIDIDKLSKKKRVDILEQAEIAKKDLSISKSTEIILNNIGIDENGDSIDLEINITRDKFKDLSRELLDRTKVVINNTLDASNLTNIDIDVVLAVGGSSRMAIVQEMLNGRFPGKTQKGVNQDEAVALGAAIQAGMRSGEVSHLDNLMIIDACNYTLGIQTVGDGFSPIIYRDTKLPAKKTNRYRTTFDEQDTVSITVYQGDNEEDVHKNTFIGEFLLDGIPKATAGEEAVDVTFEYDLNDNVTVTAKIVSTGTEIQNLMTARELTDERIKELAEELFGKETIQVVETKKVEKPKTDDSWKSSPLFEKIKVSVSLAEVKLETIDEEDKVKVISILDEIKNAVLSNNESILSSLDEKLTDLLFDLDMK